jgi:hypothetical protein
MNNGAVDRFLASLSEPFAPGPGTQRDWRQVARALGCGCPPDLLVLAEAQQSRRIVAGNWELLDADSAWSSHEELARIVLGAPCLADHARVLPLFDADGDLLLLADDGVHICSFSSGVPFGDHGTVARDLPSLLELFASQTPLPERRGSHRHAWHWVDGIEHGLSIGHHHVQRGEGWVCMTSLLGDLAPHYFRYPDGPGSPPLDGHRARARAPFTVELEGDPSRVPRALPLGVIPTPSGPLDLLDEAERFVRAAHASGWTGRDTRRVTLDGWSVLGLERPPAGGCGAG